MTGSRILAVGITYKSEVSDVRESAALEVVKLLMDEGAEVTYSDPYVSNIRIGDKLLCSANMTRDLLQSMDCVVILTDHSMFDYSIIAAASPMVLDCRNSSRAYSGSNILSL